MLLGKRPRPSMKRTTSMTGITVAVDPPQESASQPPDDHDYQEFATGDGNNNNIGIGNDRQYYYNYNYVGRGGGYNYHENNFSDERFMASMVLSPRNVNNNNNNNYNQSKNKKAVETAHFLRTCGLCKRRLAPGRDIYMYRGDTAFCSLECREQQMKQDERREKSNAMASKIDPDHHNTTSNKAASSKTETIAAA